MILYTIEHIDYKYYSSYYPDIELSHRSLTSSLERPIAGGDQLEVVNLTMGSLEVKVKADTDAGEQAIEILAIWRSF
jgi:hypothetical protein